MTLSVKDITNDLGVMPITVWRWIKDGKIKGVMVNRRIGWRIEEEDYDIFLNNHPRWRVVHDGEVYNRNETRAREDALMQLIAQVVAIKITVKREEHDADYMKGFNRAIKDITGAINREMVKKVPDLPRAQ